MTEALTVLMAVHNGEPFVGTGIESILSQTYRGFRFLIVDDASTDGTRELIRSYRDRRIDLRCLPRNVGQTAALNIGLRQVATPWVARMDADDFSAPGRFAEQMRALTEHPTIRCVGTGVWEFRQDPRVVELTRTRPRHHDDIRRAALCGSGLFHGSIVVSREALLDVGAYDEAYRYAADREMFIRLLRRYTAMNLPAPLLGLRRHPKQDSFSLEAANEYLAICQQLLADSRHTPEEVGILRESLAFAYLFRGRCLRRQGRYGAWWDDWLCAARISPGLCVRNAGGTIRAHLPPKQRHLTIRVGARRLTA